MEFNRFDICEAWYLIACDQHTGQNSELYAVFGRLINLGFIPRPGLCYESLSDNGQEIYNRLEKKYGK